jgi:Ca2+-binding EF-hand superfamily protein
LYTRIDKSKNGLCEREEFISSFTGDMPMEGVNRAELEALYDALDMNRDGFIGVNEFCLFL